VNEFAGANESSVPVREQMEQLHCMTGSERSISTR